MEHPKKAATKKAAVKNKVVVAEEENFQFFQVEDNPPPMPLAASDKRQQQLTKLHEIAMYCKVNGAILIPTELRLAAMRYLSKEFPLFKWKAFKIPDNKKQIRIYKKAHHKTND